MNELRIIRTPGGEELVLLTLEEYEDLRDSSIAAERAQALAAGRDELISSEELDVYLASPTPLAFWRKKRNLTQTSLARDVGVSQNFLSDIENGKAMGDVMLYAKLARRLKLSIEDLIPEIES
jgi:DNA-binding XRE family transcriptional regulator